MLIDEALLARPPARPRWRPRSLIAEGKAGPGGGQRGARLCLPRRRHPGLGRRPLLKDGDDRPPGIGVDGDGGQAGVGGQQG